MSRIARATLAALALAGLTAALGAAPAAHAVPLGTLVAGGTLSTSDGALAFSDFSVSIDRSTGEGDNPLYNLDLMLVDVSITGSGDTRILAIEGPLQVGAYDEGQLRIDYVVASSVGFGIVGASLSLKAEALGDFAKVAVAESISGDAAAVLRAFESEDQAARVLGGQVAFASPATQLAVSTDITLEGGRTQGSRIARLEQGFAVSSSASAVPEPGAALLFAAGVLISAVRLRDPRAAG